MLAVIFSLGEADYYVCEGSAAIRGRPSSRMGYSCPIQSACNKLSYQD